DGGVPQHAGGHRSRRFHKWHGAPEVPAPVERNDPSHAALLEVEGDERPLLEAPPDDELVPWPVEAGVLDVVLVLVRPEPVDVFVGSTLAQHAASRRLPLLEGVLPVLDPDVAAGGRVIVPRDVAGRIDPLDARTTELVDDDAVVELHPGPVDDVGGGDDPDAHDGDVAREPAALGRHYRLHPAGPLEGCHPVAEHEVDT